jgi:hypothetical protein
MSSKNSRAVRTPDGIFPSQMAAAQHYGVKTAAIRYRCMRGEQQINRHYGNDYSSWGYVNNTLVKPIIDGRCRAVVTPLGRFPSVMSAQAAHCVSASAIIMRIKRNTPGYYYADEVNG